MKVGNWVMKAMTIMVENEIFIMHLIWCKNERKLLLGFSCTFS